MDLGIDRLIEMFEERFGKRTATLLLAVIGLGAVGWAVHSIYENILSPLLPFLISSGMWAAHIHVPPPIYSARKVVIGLVAVGVFVVLLVFAWRSDKRANARLHARFDDITTYIKAHRILIADLIAEIATLRGRLGMDPIEGLPTPPTSPEWLAKIFEAPSPLPPQDTGGSRQP